MPCAEQTVDEGVAQHARQRADICEQCVHCRLCGWPDTGRHPREPYQAVDFDPDYGDPVVSPDVLHVYNHERVAPLRDPVSDRIVRKCLFSCDDREYH